ncbi:hypothetical protein ANRL1_04620 [Anaerolineae bacterium]|nr:hypothetical protein ANRL1_04620 [Anaerolineae bacterium]
MLKYLLPALLLLATPLAAQSDAAQKAAQPLDTPAPETPGKTPVEAWEDGLGRADTPVGKFRIGGYATLLHKTIEKYNGGDSTNFFDSIRIVPQFEWEIIDWLEFGMEIEFEGGGAGASFLTDNEILVEYAEARATPLDELNFKAGLLLINFGRYNKNHDDIFWDLVDRPYAARRIIPSAFDQPGVGIYGTFNQVPFLSIDYDFQVTQGFTQNFTSNGGSRDARNSFRADNNDNKALWFRLGLTPDFHTSLASADVGISYTYQEIAAGNKQALRGLGIDGGVRLDPLDRFGVVITGEWTRFWIHRPSSPTVPNGLWGYFVDVLFKFDPFPAAWRNKVFGSHPYIGLIFRVEQNDLNDDFKGAAARDDRIAFTVGLSFRPISKLVVRIEWKNQQSRERDDGDENRYVASVSVGF